MSAPEKHVVGGAGAKGPKRKRIVTTAQDRENARLRAEEVRWRAAKTPEAKAWINSSRLLKEFSASGQDMLTMKIGAATRRDIWEKGDAMGLHVETIDTRSRHDGPLESWIVLGKLSARLSVAEEIRAIQRQSMRQLQESQEEEEEAGIGAEIETAPIENIDPIDPRIREHRAPVAQMLPGIREAADSPEDADQELPSITNILGAGATNDAFHGSKAIGTAASDSGRQRNRVNQNLQTTEVADDEQDSSDLLPGEERELPRQHTAHSARETAKATNQREMSQFESGKSKHMQEQLSASQDNTGNDRISSWVHQQVQTFGPEEEAELTGKWTISCPAIAEQVGSSDAKTLELNIHITKTRPQSDNDTDDGNNENESSFLDNLNDKDVADDDLTTDQKSRLNTYQMWATFNMGLYQGIIRFMAPTVRAGTQNHRSNFDLQSSQLPSKSNRTFQYKWRGRETTDDAEISVEAENATQWIKFEDDGANLSGVFESEYLGETAFEGVKAGVAEPVRLHLGRMWSEVSPKAHEFEARQ